MANINVKDLGKVVVILGGSSSEREISLMSGNGVYNALKDAGADVYKYDPKEQSLGDLAHAKYDRAFLILHGKGGEDGIIQGLLEYLKLPYTGCGVCASAVSMDKVLTKAVWEMAGLPVPRGTTIGPDTDLEEVLKLLGKDIVIKPSKEGSSIGLYKLENATVDTLKEAVQKAQEDGMAVMAEEMIKGRELTVAVLDRGDGQGLKALPIVEIKAPSGDYDYEHKYFSDATQYICPAELPEDVANAIAVATERAAKAVGASGWGRIDLMLRDDGSFAFLEINTAPGMTPHSLVPMAAKAVGIDYTELVEIVAKGAALKG
ncbi:MAG: D-alanine--D-alanine ligase [Burkholderiales bacterium]|nr:D-alanine--D-alanine ligase [Burkholderiales bacterium]